MKTQVWFMLTLFVALSLPTFAQVLELNGGYTHMSGDGGLDGFNLGAAAWLTHRVSIGFDYDTAWDTSHVGLFELTSSGLVVSKNHLQNFLGGPRIFFPGLLKNKDKHFTRFLPFAEVQLGFSHLSSSLENRVTNESQSASDNAFTWLLGGGADYRFSEHWASRFKFDFLRTHFAEEGQSRIRLGIGILYTFGGMGKAEAAAAAKRKAETERAAAQARQEEMDQAEARRRAVIEQAEREKLAVEEAAHAKRKAEMDLAAAEARNKIASEQLAAQEASDNPQKESTQNQNTDAAASAAQARAQGHQEATDQATREKEALRARLLEQFNRILPTTDTPRGLAVDMDDVLFDLEKADIRPEAREDLAKFVGIVLSYPSLRFAVEGHTDNTGAPEFNQTLSTKRANNVREYLISHGLNASSVSAQGLGMNNPIADNSTTEGRQKNRRVEIIVSGEAIGTKIGR